MKRSQRPRLRCVPISLRRMKSPSETIPASSPLESTTGRPLICFCNIMLAASTIVASGPTVMTGFVMIWWARMGTPKSSRLHKKAIPVAAAGFDRGQARSVSRFDKAQEPALCGAVGFNDIIVQEVPMAELFQSRAEAAEPRVAGSSGRANKRMEDLLFGVQRMCLEEIVFAADEWLDRAR